MIDRNENIDYIKGFAIISVLSAHCNAVSDASHPFATFSSLLLQNIGTLGVICFFVLSGMLFHYPGKNKYQFFKKKSTHIVIPWIISASCVYLYVYLRKPPITFNGWLNFVLGNGSYCYYLLVLMMLYFIFTIIPFMRRNTMLFICEGITIVSTIWFYNIGGGGINPYINLLNWIGYFALGVQISENHDIWNKICKFTSKRLLSLTMASLTCYLAILAYQLYHQNGGGYWDGINVIACWLGAICMVLLAIKVKSGKDNCFKRLIHLAGLKSFGIYLWHMPIAGIVARLMNISFLDYFVLLRPLIVLFVMLFLFKFLEYFINKMKLCYFAKFIGLH